MAVNLCTLPPEIIDEILSHLKGEDICRVASCSRQLRLRALKEHVWKDCAKRDYSVELDVGAKDSIESHSARLFYMLVLRKYGFWVGKYLQRSNFKYYGGLAIMLYHDWSLYLVILHPPPFPHIERDLQPEALCKVSLDSAGKINVQSCNSYGGIESVKLTCSGSNETLEYKEESDPEIDMDVQFSKFKERFGLDHEFFDWEGVLVTERFHSNMQYIRNGHQTFSRLSMTNLACGFEPISQGVYKGTYNVHGIELVHVYYDNASKSIIGRKVTGDPNVPCKEITFQASLVDPIFLPENVLDLSGIEAYLKNDHMSMDFLDLCSTYVAPTKFDIMDCEYDWDMSDDIFRTKTWQFKCSCQVSPENFSDPEMIDGVLIVFSKDVFGVIFLEDFGSLIIFRRAEMRNFCKMIV